MYYEKFIILYHMNNAEKNQNSQTILANKKKASDQKCSKNEEKSQKELENLTNLIVQRRGWC